MRIKRMFFRVLIFFVFVYSSICGYLHFTQEAQIFPGQFMPLTLQTPLADSNEVTFKTDDGYLLNGAYYKPVKNSDTVLIYFGGNGDNAKRFLYYAKKFVDKEVVAFNYRGFAKSKGEPSEESLFKDALQIYDFYAKDKNAIIVGRSLGSGVGVYVASQKDAKGLILVTPFDSILSMAKEKYPLLPVGALLKHKFESDKYMKNVTAKIAVIELKHDEVVPNWHTKKLISKIDSNFYHGVVEGTTHGDILKDSNFQVELKNALDYVKIDKNIRRNNEPSN